MKGEAHGDFDGLISPFLSDSSNHFFTTFNFSGVKRLAFAVTGRPLVSITWVVLCLILFSRHNVGCVIPGNSASNFENVEVLIVDMVGQFTVAIEQFTHINVVLSINRLLFKSGRRP